MRYLPIYGWLITDYTAHAMTARSYKLMQEAAYERQDALTRS